MLSLGAVVAMSCALAAFAAYVCTSVLFFKFPLILHKKRHLKFTCTHISHRGGAGEKLENTMEAFQHAVSLGTDMLELDVHLTKDDHVVVSHDHNLLRATGVDVDISAVAYAQLPALRQTLPIDFERGRVFSACADADRRIPTLRHVFTAFPQTPINIDIKTDNDRLVYKVSQLIKEFEREEVTVWGNMSQRVVDKCHKENPNIPLLFSFRSVVLLLVKLYTGVLPFLPIRESCLEIFIPSVIFNKGNIKNLKYSTALRLLVWCMDRLLLKRCLFDHLSKRGIQTYLWVLNRDEDYEMAFRLGVTGVMTDYPSKLKAFLDKNPHYRNRAC